MKIRTLKESDVLEAAAIVGRNYSKKWEKTSARELAGMFSNAPIRPVYFVAEEQGRIIGFAGLTQSWMDYDVFQIFWVNVLPERQGEGVGKKLVGRILSEIRKKKNALLIQLTATKKNASYYRTHFGFKSAERLGNTDHYLMTLQLKSQKKS